ncbi:MAG: hypothetical protein ACJAY8_000145 [Sphingobacteriales bacterium]|jgi:uncharacterized protein YyaL (SSP411 family)
MVTEIAQNKPKSKNHWIKGDSEFQTFGRFRGLGLVRSLLPFLWGLGLVGLCGCSSVNSNFKKKSMSHQYTNELIKATSPYLLQHAHNPVNWIAWRDDLSTLALVENKLILVSIGYSACHWCHVMEKECFEDAEVAEIMNAHFICVKVDREEHPDVDQVFMASLQLMGQQGGWPLNVITTPEGLPVYGGTYFPKGKWIAILKQLNTIWEEEPEKMREYGEELKSALQKNETLIPPSSAERDWKLVLEKARNGILKNGDKQWGGHQGAPKFPVPSHLKFALEFGHFAKDTELLKYVYTALDNMATGGIFDQVGGGFSRYATDAAWKIPHFEKMLYDNAQLIELYSEAFLQSKNPYYLQIAERSAQFCLRELQDEDGLFFCALDADSEGVEGKYYVWNQDELDSLFSPALIRELEDKSGFERPSHWEHGLHINMKKEATPFSPELIQELNKIEEKRSQRIHPGLDNKKLVSWNGLMVSGLTALYKASNNKKWLKAAELVGIQLWQQHKAGLKHVVGTDIEALLEDYTFVSAAFFDLFEQTQNVDWLNRGSEILTLVLADFGQEHPPFFTVRKSGNNRLISASLDRRDDVIPSANSTLALMYYRYGRILGEIDWIDRYQRMLSHQLADIEQFPYSNGQWARLVNFSEFEPGDVVIAGDSTAWTAIEGQYYPGFSFISSDLNLAICQGKELVDDQSTYYICKFGTCLAPRHSLNNIYE